MGNQFIEVKFTSGKTMTVSKRSILTFNKLEENNKHTEVVVGEGGKSQRVIVLEEYTKLRDRLGTDVL